MFDDRALVKKIRLATTTSNDILPDDISDKPILPVERASDAPARRERKYANELSDLPTLDEYAAKQQVKQPNTGILGKLLKVLGKVSEAHKTTQSLAYAQGTGNWSQNVDRHLVHKVIEGANEQHKMRGRAQEYKKIFGNAPNKETSGHFDYFNQKKDIEENSQYTPEEKKSMLEELDKNHKSSPVHAIRKINQQGTVAGNEEDNVDDLNSDEFKNTVKGN